MRTNLLRTTLRNSLPALLALSATTAMALDGLVLGLPLGKPMDRVIGDCISRQKPSDYCLMVGGIGGDTSSIGPSTRGPLFLSLMLPSASPPFPIPSWVSAVFVRLNERGEVVMIRAETSEGVNHQDDMISSISARFGQPTLRSPTGYQNGYGATWTAKTTVWEKPDAVVFFDCPRRSDCVVIIRTPEENARFLEEARKKRERDKM
jgi:hypothetical protein